MTPPSEQHENCKHHDMYRLFDEHGRLLYIGISYSALARLGDHMAGQPWARDVRTVEITPLGVMTREDAEQIEREAIQSERPWYNRKHAEAWLHWPGLIPPDLCDMCGEYGRGVAMVGQRDYPGAVAKYTCTCGGSWTTWYSRTHLGVAA